MMNTKPFLIVLEGHEKVGKNRFADILIDRFLKNNFLLRDMRSYCSNNTSKRKKEYTSNLQDSYLKITDLLLKEPKNSIITKWIRNERIFSLIENRESFEYLLEEDLIHDAYRVVTITMLYDNYNEYVNRLRLKLKTRKLSYNKQDFDDITEFFIEEYLGYPPSYGMTSNEETNDGLDLNEDEDIDVDYIEEDNPDFILFHNELEFLIDVASDFDSADMSIEDAWNILYPIVLNSTAHEPPPMIYFTQNGSSRN